MKWMNCTPHDINIVREDGAPVTTIHRSGVVARVTTSVTYCGEIGGVDTYKSVLGEVENLPEYASDVNIVVSGMVRAAVPGRDDLYQPGKLIRDSNGRPIGCVGLSQ